MTETNDSISEFTWSYSKNCQQLMGGYTVRTNCLSQQLFIVKPSQGAGALCVPPLHCDGELRSSILDKSPSSNYSCILRNWTRPHHVQRTVCLNNRYPDISLVIQLCGFDLYVPGDQGCWTHFQICMANGISLLKTNIIKFLIISKVGLVFFFKKILYFVFISLLLMEEHADTMCTCVDYNTWEGAVGSLLLPRGTQGSTSEGQAVGPLPKEP